MRTTSRSILHDAMTMAGAAGLGMLAMYLLDPDGGRRRRALAADKVRSARQRMGHVAEMATRDTANRGRGAFARLRSRITGGRRLTGRRIEQRVRAQIGRAVSNPHAIGARADDDGLVVLSGPVLADQVRQLMRAVWSVRGVRSVENRLQVYQEAGSVPALQGTLARRGGSMMVSNWPPSLRLLAAAAGIASAALSLSRGRTTGLFGALAGGALLARSLTNQSLGAIAGLSGAHSVHIDKEMYIAAPTGQVFEFWCHQENFPRFMRNVEDVRAAGTDQWHWKVAGPFRPVEWDAQIVEREENRRLVWRTLPGAAVESEGRVDFEPDGDGTRLRVSLSYTPTAGAVGHLFARLLGKDAKTEMDEDLMRVKSFLETGTPAHDAYAAKEARGEEGARLH